MSEKPFIYLDRQSDALVPDGCLVVENEVAFLRVALLDRPLMVRGPVLCRWAEAFFPGRGRACVSLRSPLAELRTLCPGLTQEQALWVREALGDAFGSLPTHPTLLHILRRLLPSGPWQEATTSEHAARWLLWADEAQLPDQARPLISAQLRDWEVHAGDDLAPAYHAQTTAEVREVLESWLGIRKGAEVKPRGSFPLPIPPKWRERARVQWAREVVTSKIGLLGEILFREAPQELVSLAAEGVAAYYSAHPEELDAEIIEQLSPFVGLQSLAPLRERVPPPVPGAVPSDLSAVVAWFEREYLPYRRWQAEHAAPEPTERISKLARGFAQWYLAYCARGLNGGDGNLHFAFSRSSELNRTREGRVTLWVVLDGLHWDDAQYLLTQLVEEPRLSPTRLDVALAPLPTITEVCKPALFSGKPPVEIAADEPRIQFPNVKELRDSRDWAAELQSAQTGDLFLWSLVEPDKTYHGSQDARTVRMHALGELDTIARKVRAAVLSVPDELQLRVAISTDHGRLFSTGERTHAVPAEMKTHGRSAYGDCGRIFDSSGISVDEEAGVAYLSRGRFNLPLDCAIALDGNVFRANDGRGGREHFPHGGAYPEEVLVPWFEFERDIQPIELACTLGGSAQTGRTGIASVRVLNPGSVAVRGEAMRLTLANGKSRQLSLTGSFSARHESTIELEIEDWPTSAQLEQASAVAVFVLPGGRSFPVTVDVQLAAEELYRQSLSIDDLEW